MQLTNSRQGYGWMAIALHWVSAVGITALYFLGERMEEAADRTQRVAAENLHVSVAVLLFTFLAARVLWSLSQPHPEPLERRRLLRYAAFAVQAAFLLMIAVLLVSGPLAVWSTTRPLPVFGLFAIPSPFPARLPMVHEAAEAAHGAAAKLFWPLIGLHLAGALKHVVVDRDATLRRMLAPRQA